MRLVDAAASIMQNVRWSIGIILGRGLVVYSAICPTKEGRVVRTLIEVLVLSPLSTQWSLSTSTEWSTGWQPPLRKLSPAHICCAPTYEMTDEILSAISEASRPLTGIGPSQNRLTSTFMFWWSLNWSSYLCTFEIESFDLNDDKPKEQFYTWECHQESKEEGSFVTCTLTLWRSVYSVRVVVRMRYWVIVFSYVGAVNTKAMFTWKTKGSALSKISLTDRYSTPPAHRTLHLLQ